MLGGELAASQATVLGGLLPDPFSLLDDGAGAAKFGGSGRHAAQLSLGMGAYRITQKQFTIDRARHT